MSRRIRFSDKSAKVQKEVTVKKYGNNDLNEDKVRENQHACVSCKSSSRSNIKGGKNNKHKKNKLQKGGKNNSDKRNKLQKGGNSDKNAKDEIISRPSRERNRALSKNHSEHIETIQPGISIKIMSDRRSKETISSNISINFFGIDQQQLYKQKILDKGLDILVRALESTIENRLEQPESEKEQNGSSEQIKRVSSEETIRILTRGFYQLIGIIIPIIHKYLLGI